MATRIEKMFRLSTIKLTDSILNEINEFLEYSKTNSKRKAKSNDKCDALMYAHIAHSIDKFYQQHDITDEEIQRAIKKGK